MIRTDEGTPGTTGGGPFKIDKEQRVNLKN